MQKIQFSDMELSNEMQRAVEEMGFEEPTSIQAASIPMILSGRDVIGHSQTGTGKTAAFSIPAIEKINPAGGRKTQVLILCPTRELAVQACDEIRKFAKYKPFLKVVPIYGGQPIERQFTALRGGAQIVVGTPGRVMDHMRRGTLKLDTLHMIILDEADEMLNMGFIEDIEEIMHAMTGPKRVLLFSATMPDRIAALARNYMHEPDLLKVESQHVTTDLTNQIYFEVREGDKFDALTRIIDVEPEFYGIVFSRTRTGADDIVAKLLERGYAAEVLHGDISQAQREKILGKFKKKQVNILVATDVAARGIDVSNLTHVINYSLPQDSDSYVHRIGRTGRAGNQGTAITFISPSEMRKFGFLKRTIKADIKLEQLPTPADIIATKRNKIKEDLDAIVESESYGECTGMAAELLENYPPEVALSALLRLAFKNELSESSYPEIRSIDVDRKGKARIFLAFGARDGYDTRKTVRLLKQECGLSDHDIDDVRVMADFSFATVPFDRAEKVVRPLNRLSHGRPIAEISKDTPSARTSGRKQTHRRRESDTRSGRKTDRKPESKDTSVQEALGAPDDRNGHRKSVRSPKTSGTKAGKKPVTTAKAGSKTYTPEKTAAKRTPELPENWFEKWFGQRQPARNKKGPNRTPKRKNRD